ncbi:DUF3830 family protein [Caballeronia sp. INDeC2]|uniref:DUF3830 family protein n=1 Tax=Caballeronia sp. INDeC2 TaxID=2921747 RepID=UPI00202787E4|nr:DUF3830 family protein [Caballeronia sp. INDeC2]
MKRIKITSGEYVYFARLEEESAPKSCAWFLNKLPFKSHISQGRWSGKAVFIRLGTTAAELGYENATSYPQNGDVVLYPGDATRGGGEIYMPYGPNEFSCEYGKIAGSRFLTIIKNQDSLPKFGELVHWDGAQEIVFELE